MPTAPPLEHLTPNADRLSDDLRELSEHIDDTQAGWTRTVFSEPYRASRDWVRARMAAAGLETHRDGAGNIIGRLPGHSSARPLVTGSHTDTVPGGGRFDGTVGVLGAIEAARRLRETGTHLAHDLLVCDFQGEEANPFGFSCLGSRAVAGHLTPSALASVDGEGKRLGDALTRSGTDPSAMLDAGWGPVHAYVELHIEQGPALERRGSPIGVVTHIAGLQRFLATFTGRNDHAGSRAMDDRRDALAAAAAAVLTVERLGCGAPGHGVATTGDVRADPGAWNVVPGGARLWGEIRSTDSAWLGTAGRDVAEQIIAESRRRGVDVDIGFTADGDVVGADPAVQDIIAETCTELGIDWIAMPSGASHDAAHMASLGPMGMLFVPSRAGRSHCPDEWTEIADIAIGARVLTAALVQLDRTDRPLRTA